jgi:4-alpha-glucanotransferase
MSTLHRLADAAGLRIHWHDYRGRAHTVGDDTLRRLLAALGLPADDDARAHHSLNALRRERDELLPPTVVGRVGQPLRLPPALARRCGKTVLIGFEDGSERRLDCRADPRGEVHLHGIDRPGYHRLQLAEHSLTVAMAPAAEASDAQAAARHWAVAVQLYSLRRDGDLGLGDFSTLAGLARSLGASGAEAIAISPVHAQFSADVDHYSPYSPSSRLFLSALHIDPAALAGERFLQQRIDALGLRDLVQQLAAEPLIDWPRAARLKLALLRDAWQQLDHLAMAEELRSELACFREAGGQALEDHARFEAIHAIQFAADPARWHWRHWPAGLRDPRSAEVEAFAREHADEVSFHCFLQWLADRGLAEAQAVARAAGMGIGLIADLAVGTDSGGSHSWSRQDDMLIGVTIGAPPDELNSRGQNWGLSTFSPRALQMHGYGPFIELLRASLSRAGGLRIDHVLGLNQLWLVPESAAAPTEGAYLRYPLQDLLNLIALEASRHAATIVGEDLGTVPAGFRSELAAAGLLGMRVLYFERDHGRFIAPPHWPTRSIATTTTHDLPTVAGWWLGRDLHWQDRVDLLPPGSDLASELQQRRRDRQALWPVFRRAGVADGEPPGDDDPQPAVDAAIAFIAQTPAPLAVIPIEDLLGDEEQPNLPGTVDQHPNWRRRLAAPAQQLLAEPRAAARLARLRQLRGAPAAGGSNDESVGRAQR